MDPPPQKNSITVVSQKKLSNWDMSEPHKNVPIKQLSPVMKSI